MSPVALNHPVTGTLNLTGNITNDRASQTANRLR
jgi:hypothetical protein